MYGYYKDNPYILAFQPEKVVYLPDTQLGKLENCRENSVKKFV